MKNETDLASSLHNSQIELYEKFLLDLHQLHRNPDAIHSAVLKLILTLKYVTIGEKSNYERLDVIEKLWASLSTLPGEPSANTTLFKTEHVQIKSDEDSEKCIQEIPSEKAGNATIDELPYQPISAKDTPMIELKNGSPVLLEFVGLNPDELFVRLGDKDSLIYDNKTINDAAIAGQNAPPLPSAPKVRDIVLAYDETSLTYQRAVILQISDDNQEFKVCFIDKGLNTVLSANNLRQITSSLAGRRAVAKRVKLADVRQQVSPTEGVKYINELISKKERLKCILLEGNDIKKDGIYLKIESNKEDVGSKINALMKPVWEALPDQEKIVDLPTFQSKELIVQLEPGTITVSSTDDLEKKGWFSCFQMEWAAYMQLDLITERIKIYGEKFNKPYMPSYRELCFIKHEDGKWYRGMVENKVNEMALIALLDFGTMVSVHMNNIRKATLPEFSELRTLSARCFMEGLPERPWSKRLVTRLVELLQGPEVDGVLVESARKLKDTLYFSVSLPEVLQTLKKERLVE